MRRSVLPATVLLGLSLLGACARPLERGPLEAGVLAAQEDRWDEAVRYWTAVLEQNPGSAAGHNNLAVALEKTGDWDGAGREYEAALRLAPDSAEIKANYESFRLRFETGRKKGA